jgi:phosphoribosylanthranilate isomerase
MLSGPMLSGGINLDNIVEALTLSNAGAVDISSGVEKAPGIKDPALISALLNLINDYNNLPAPGLKTAQK